MNRKLNRKMNGKYAVLIYLIDGRTDQVVVDDKTDAINLMRDAHEDEGIIFEREGTDETVFYPLYRISKCVAVPYVESGPMVRALQTHTFSG